MQQIDIFSELFWVEVLFVLTYRLHKPRFRSGHLWTDTYSHACVINISESGSDMFCSEVIYPDVLYKK